MFVKRYSLNDVPRGDTVLGAIRKCDDNTDDIYAWLNQVKANFYGSGAPGSPALGDVWFDGTHGVPKMFNGTTWKTLGHAKDTPAWFYQNVAPLGWTIVTGMADCVVAVTGGSNDYSVNGGEMSDLGGAWVPQANHTHSVAAHVHGGLGHTHTMSMATANGGSSNSWRLTSQTTDSTSPSISSSGAAASAAGGTAATWRPLAAVGIVCSKD